jgi:hypothetical protein
MAEPQQAVRPIEPRHPTAPALPPCSRERGLQPLPLRSSITAFDQFPPCHGLITSTPGRAEVRQVTRSQGRPAQQMAANTSLDE